MTTEVKIIILICALVLLFASAFFSSSEYVYSSINKFKILKDVENKKKRSALVKKITENYSYTISIILIGNNLVNILMTSLVTVVAMNSNVSEALSIVILTVVVLIFGEMLPKIIGQRYSYTLAYIYSVPITWFSYLVYPVVKSITWLINKISFIWTPKVKDNVDASVELNLITDQLEEEGVIDQNDAKLIHKAIELSDSTVHEIMTPRVDMYAIDINDPDEEILKDPDLYRFTRVPVYDESKDDIIGILDTVALMKKRLSKQNVKISEMLTTPLFIPKHMEVVSLLSDFKEKDINMAIILDEFGGVMGIVTLEDIIEELVGDIFDETDIVKYDYVVDEDGNYIVDGDMNIYDFFDLIEYDDSDFMADYTTVGGWCSSVLQELPETGDQFDFENIHVTVINTSSRRVEEVKVEIKKGE